MSEERDDLVVLIDEDGKEVEFEHVDTIEKNGKEYVVLMPANAEQDEALEDDEVVILKIEKGEDGEDSFVTVDDDEELDEVFEEFLSRLEDDEYEDDEDE